MNHAVFLVVVGFLAVWPTLPSSATKIEKKLKWNTEKIEEELNKQLGWIKRIDWDHLDPDRVECIACKFVAEAILSPLARLYEGKLISEYLPKLCGLLKVVQSKLVPVCKGFISEFKVSPSHL